MVRYGAFDTQENLQIVNKLKKKPLKKKIEELSSQELVGISDAEKWATPGRS
ncbi:MAG: hypothetical protein O4808_03450 [Trichodesmium sp. St17_bin3_1_1]|nr:hypothetical protein [Trichodesmium sp. St18_bin1]MDE5106153.1 hypothetical protein [Trichodesmium sp. St17_bin3_1_1]MDE5121225.1 hypothetical protein [Trichodesmium sp. St19_bin1]